MQHSNEKRRKEKSPIFILSLDNLLAWKTKRGPNMHSDRMSFFIPLCHSKDLIIYSVYDFHPCDTVNLPFAFVVCLFFLLLFNFFFRLSRNLRCCLSVRIVKFMDPPLSVAVWKERSAQHANLYDINLFSNEFDVCVYLRTRNKYALKLWNSI